jgi:hypothetical protein
MFSFYQIYLTNSNKKKRNIRRDRILKILKHIIEFNVIKFINFIRGK